MTIRAGIDFGGSAVKIGLVDAAGNVLRRASVPFDRDADFETMAERVAAALEGLAQDRGLEAIGISAPGWADPETGILADGTNNVPALGGGQSLPAYFRQRFGVPATIDNDGTCATLGELRFGAGRGLSRFVLITLGTGVGGGIVVDGRPILGTKGTPPELGALCLDPDGPVNYSGIPGTFEQMACAASMVQRYRAAGGEGQPSAKDVFARAAAGDRAALAAVDGTARIVAQAFGVMVNMLNPEACIVGGGMALAGDALIDRIRGHLPDFTWPLLCRNVRVVAAALGNDAGLIGAAVRAAEHGGSTE